MPTKSHGRILLAFREGKRDLDVSNQYAGCVNRENVFPVNILLFNVFVSSCPRTVS